MSRAETEPGEFRCPWHDTHIENFGKSGKNGRLGTVIGEVKGLKIDMKLVKAEQAAEKIRLGLLVGGMTFVGSGLMAILVHLIKA